VLIEKTLEYFFMNKSQGKTKKAHPHVSRIVFPAQHLHRWGFKMRFQASVRGSFHFCSSCGDHVFQTCHVIRSCMQETQVVPHLLQPR
jgi:hypothetical protein